MLRNARCPGVSNQSSLGDTISQSSFSTHNYDPNLTLYVRIRTSRRAGSCGEHPFATIAVRSVLDRNQRWVTRRSGDRSWRQIAPVIRQVIKMTKVTVGV